MRRRIAASTIFVAVLGSLLHFAWEWSGRNPVLAIFAATSESTWEHLKLAFWPALLLAPIQRLVYGHPRGFLPGTALRCLLPPLLIVVLFHGYTAILGTNHLVLDIGTFVVAIFTGELAGHRAMDRPASPALRVGATAVILLATVAFATLTFRPPDFFLFDDLREQGHGSHAAAP